MNKLSLQIITIGAQRFSFESMPGCQIITDAVRARFQSYEGMARHDCESKCPQ